MGGKDLELSFGYDCQIAVGQPSGTMKGAVR